jgi:hypothetical protein
MAALMSGLGRIAFVHTKHADAERWYGDVVTRFWDSHFPPAAMYWRAAAHYKAANDHTAPRTVAEDLRSTYPSSVGRARRLRDCINNAEVESVFDSRVFGYTEVGPQWRLRAIAGLILVSPRHVNNATWLRNARSVGRPQVSRNAGVAVGDVCHRAEKTFTGRGPCATARALRHGEKMGYGFPALAIFS